MTAPLRGILDELTTWRRDLRAQLSQLICSADPDARLRLVDVTSALSHIEQGILSLQAADNALHDDIIEQIEREPQEGTQ